MPEEAPSHTDTPLSFLVLGRRKLNDKLFLTKALPRNTIPRSREKWNLQGNDKSPNCPDSAYKGEESRAGCFHSSRALKRADGSEPQNQA